MGIEIGADLPLLLTLCHDRGEGLVDALQVGRHVAGTRGAPDQLEQHLAGQSSRLSDPVRSLRGEPGETLPSASGGLQLLLDREAEEGEDLAGHLVQDGPLAGEVVEEGGGSDVRRRSDLLHGGGVDALGEKEPPGGVVDPRVILALSPVSPPFPIGL